MNWDRIQESWKQLKEKFVLQWFRVTDDNGKGLQLIGAEMSGDDRSVDATGRLSPRRPRNAERVFVAHWLLNCRVEVGNLLTWSHDPSRLDGRSDLSRPDLSSKVS